ncbi:flagellar hook assembly protein FlgD [Brenneria goodwinii]|uniref:Basal-body rod modification protein FlgD n=1 Tax=Brenneria goodwinii TaxID=1109412 RepID=A0A0G4K1X2_9GAMM|nr:flagellar hook assembly protein FlgD [Brenneria goodwinii]MCG8158115.1 flagellar hook assembly protein FlgD [Brenneria goodwinii]MCG8162456.1 flagellar hook assembly protein FlgD [Brenneria goodwinii]MCG8167166.1 flagellar hook assembly protein FlgD [Brenneria goodwinii]MCG8171826.1 flagellar hook assembly protein FlgD [Brenneria goodwinii]MCG8176542.1 flagellar hook assembly protein FlgD [Brenneria goodwinii]
MSIAISVNESTDNSSVTATSSSTGSTSADLQSEFLTLLVAQLQNQDPTDPMDNSQLTSQLAQISTLSGIEKLNTTLGSISGQLDTSQALQASTLIGHGVLISGNSIVVGENSSVTPFGIELDSAASNVTVTIKNSSGSTVRTVSLGEQSAGIQTYSWDGTDDSGTAVAEGSYTYTVTATSSAGSSVVATPLKYALVYGVNTSSDGSTLNLGLSGTATLSDVKQII